MLTLLVAVAQGTPDVAPVFVDVSEAAGIAATHRAIWDVYDAKEGDLAVGQAWGECDNDGWLDLFLAASGLPFLSASFHGGAAPDLEDFRNPYPDAVFRNDGDGTFTGVSPRALDGAHRPTLGFAYADCGHDGHVDFVVGVWDEGYAHYRNRGTAAPATTWHFTAASARTPCGRS